MTTTSSNPFSDLNDFIALPRVDGLALSPDGSRVVLTVSTLDAKKTGYRRSLWAVDAQGGGTARRLTRSAKGEGGAVFTGSGDLLFVSGRPDPDSDNASNEAPDVAQLWSLPAGGGEASPVTHLAGGVDAILASATGADTVLLSAPLLPSSTSLADDAERRRVRDDKKVGAILHSSFPVRFWDHDLGPDQTHLLAVDPAGDIAVDPAVDLAGGPALDPAVGPAPVTAAAEPRDLTPNPARSLDLVDATISPDGRFAVATSAVQQQRGSRRTLIGITLATPVAASVTTTIADDPGADFNTPALSPDGSMLAYARLPITTRTFPGDIELWVANTDGSEARRVAAAWDRWPSSLAFSADGTGLVVTADQGGRGPVFVVTIATGAVSQLTNDEFAYTSVAVERTGSFVFALRSSWLEPSHPVRIDLATGTVTLLATPAKPIEVPATMTEVEATALDGTPLRSWLLLPKTHEGPAPLLLWIHGGPLGSWNAWSWRWNPLLMVEAGYAVLLPDPALSTGYGLDFIRRGWGSWGDKPFTDLMAVTDVAEGRPDIDEHHVAAMGGSFGGYMANWVAGHTDRFMAIVSHASLWNLDQFMATTDHGYSWQRQFSPEAAAENSPHASVANISTPMLVIHGDHDYRVPLGQSLRMWAELAEHHAAADGTTPHRFLFFPDENHWVLKPQNAVVWYETVLAFLDEHVHGAEWKRPELLG